MTKVEDRFLRYVKFDTQSDENSTTCPSSDKQKILGAALVEEMQAMGIADAYMDEYGYVYGSVAGDSRLPTIGLIAHMDTSPDASGENVNPKIVLYAGEDILLNEELGIYLKESEYEGLGKHHGKRLIVTDGTTLLGADDKAGIAEILTAVEVLITTGRTHCPIKIAFTPDEEIGCGTDHFNLSDFGADYAYTVDGGAAGELEFENFNGAGAMVQVNGLNIHPGSAKGKMRNAQRIAMEFDALLPGNEKPEYTDGYEGFIHLTDMEGCVESAVLKYIIRDHDKEKFNTKKVIMEKAADYLNQKYGNNTIDLKIQDSYYNMREKIEPVMHIVEHAKQAMQEIGMEPKLVPIRGGTDGARLSFMGLPCPNLCTGGENFHGRYEYIPIEDMELCVKLLVEIVTTVKPK